MREILSPTDFSEPAVAALDVARAYAERFGARLHLLHVAWPAATGPRPLLSAVADELRRTVPVCVATAGGDAASEIVRYAEENDVDLIVMGTHGRTGVSRVLLGSVAERVIRHARCPVLTVPPRRGREENAKADLGEPTSASQCLACASPSPDLICEPCRARIRGEALERKQREERAGRM